MAKPPVFYLGTHMDGWLAHVGVPLFVSHRRLARRKTLPKARPHRLGAGLGWILRAVALRWLADHARGVRV
jgi:hypothetical protein